MAARTVFTLTSGRSGTRFLCDLLRRNARDCFVVHEPYLDRGNPTMFGLPIYDRQVGHIDAVRRLVRRKRERVERLRVGTYIETSHAFLKSYWDIAPSIFPDMRVLHLIRHPLHVARSEANRERLLQRLRLPFRRYRGRDGRRYFRWSLTGLEPIFSGFDAARTTLFQRYLLQWIEIENRAMQFLEHFHMDVACLTLFTPDDLNDPAAIGRVLEFLGLERSRDEIVVEGTRNRNPGRGTTVGEDEERECREVIDRLPPRYLAIFRRQPYAGQPWTGLLEK